MTRFFEPIDRLAGAHDETGMARWLDRTAFIFVTLMVVTCPHSIAASETSWVIALVATIARYVVGPRRKFKFRPLDIAIWAFFGWSVVSAAVSYSPAISLDMLRNVGLFLVYFLAGANVRNLRAAYFLAFALFFSCMVNVVKTPIERIVGRGVEISGVRPDGPLGKALLADGDAILKVSGKKVTDPAVLAAELGSADVVKISMYRPGPELYETREIKRADLLPGLTVNEQLGISGWGPDHYWRAMGFFNHWTTYSEALQLIGSMVFGLLVASLFYRKGTEDRDQPESGIVASFTRFVSSRPFMAVCFAGICIAMLMTVTRASEVSLLISGLVIVSLSASRKLLIAAVIVAVPVALVGFVLLKQSRPTGDEAYRQMMWRDGYRLMTDRPRNFIFGIGMDSVKEHWRDWGMFENGLQPIGHFHSTPVQIAVERGLPALLLWMLLLAVYARMLWRALRSAKELDWRTAGILLGCLGGAIGFVTSGMVHNNLGDGEVAMIFYLMMGMGVTTTELSDENLRIQSRTS